MPYVSEHAARIRDPQEFIKNTFRRKNITDGIDIIIGQLKSTEKWEEQSYRFKKDKFTAEEAKKWLDEHNIKYILFEPAIDNTKNLQIVNKSDKAAEVYMFGDIYDDGVDNENIITPNRIKKEIESVKNKEHIHLFVNSGGGSVFAALSIYHMIKELKGYVVAHVVGLAASAAAWMIASADKIVMPINSLLMLHLPIIFTSGNKKKLEQDIKFLEQIEEIIAMSFIRKNGKMTKDKIKEILNGNDEFWVNGEEAFNLGLVDEIECPISMVNGIDFVNLDGIVYPKTKYKNISSALLNEIKPYEKRLETINQKIKKLTKGGLDGLSKVN